MTTRSVMRTSIRDELNDNAATKIWTDALLNGFLTDAFRDYSRKLPRHALATIIAVADQESYTLPADVVELQRVTQPDDVIRYREDPLRTSQGAILPATLVDYQSRVAEAARAMYWVWGNTITLDPAPASAANDQNVTIWYLGAYTEPAADADTLSTPPADDDLIRRLACAYALDWIDTDEAKRQQFTRETGSTPRRAASHYRALVADEIARRRARLRTSTLEPS